MAEPKRMIPLHTPVRYRNTDWLVVGRTFEKAPKYDVRNVRSGKIEHNVEERLLVVMEPAE